MVQFLSNRVAWPLVMGLITFLAVKLASHNTATAFFVALLPAVLGFINVFRMAGFTVAGLAVVYAVYVFVTPAGTRAQIAAGAANTLAKARPHPDPAAANASSNVTSPPAPAERRSHHRHAGSG